MPLDLCDVFGYTELYTAMMGNAEKRAIKRAAGGCKTAGCFFRRSLRSGPAQSKGRRRGRYPPKEAA